MDLSFELPNEKDDAFYPTSSMALRQAIYVRDGGVCKVCGARVEFLHYDLSHIVDKSMGGKLVASNLLLCCHYCNIVKPKQKTRDEFLVWMKLGAWITPIVARAKSAGLDIDEEYVVANRDVFANMGWNTKSESAKDEIWDDEDESSDIP